MKVTTNPNLQAPRNLTSFKGPQDNNQLPEGPNKGPGFGDRFISSLDRNSEKISDVLLPLGVMFAGGAVGRMVGGMGLGVLGGLTGSGQTAMVMAQVGGLAGGLAGSFIGYRFGAKIKDKPGNLIENVTGNSKVGRTLLTTAYAGALGGAITSLAVGGIAPGPFAIGAGLTVAGLGLYSAFKA